MIKTYKPNDTARIEAMLFTEELAESAERWTEGDLKSYPFVEKQQEWKVHTLEGWVNMPFGSYLIKGTNGEFYPCDPDIFENRWVEV